MSVSDFAPDADFASRRSCSSMCNVFFMPYDYAIADWHGRMATHGPGTH